MRRSRSIALVMMASVGAAAVASCDDGSGSNAEEVFTGVDECIGTEQPDVCSARIIEARDAFDSAAPRFQSQSGCETEFGAGFCQPRHDANGTAWFMPALAGFVLARSFSSQVTPVYYSPLADIPASPLPDGRDCRDPRYQQTADCRAVRPLKSGQGGGASFYWRTSSSGSPAGSSSGFTSVARGASPSTARSAAANFAVARGGFGGAAEGHGSAS